MNIRGRILQTLAFATLLFLFNPSHADAQEDPPITNNDLKGIVPFGTYDFGNIDSINLATGGLDIRIPLVARKQRGPFDTGLALVYSSKRWIPAPYSTDPSGQPLNALQWTPSLEGYDLPHVVGTLDAGSLDFTWQQYGCNNGQPLNVIANLALAAFDGSKYQFPNRTYTHTGPLTGCQGSLNQVLTGYSDSRQLQLAISGTTLTVSYKDGHKITAVYSSTFAQPVSYQVTDANGNIIAGGSTDTVGRNAFYDSSGNALNFPVTRTPGSSGATLFPTTGSPSMPNCISQYPSGGLQNTTLTLPNGQTYSFTMAPNFGEVSQVTLPTGGYIKYVWGTIPQMDDIPTTLDTCAISVGFMDSRRVSERHLSADGVNEVVWHYAYSRNGSTVTTTVTDPLGNVTVYKFSKADNIDPGHETERDIYDNAGHLLRKINRTWQSKTANVQSNQDQTCLMAAQNFLPTSTTTTLPDSNQVSQTLTTYDSSLTQPTVCRYAPGADSRGNVTETKEYDYGAGAPGSLLRRTDFTYLHDSNSQYLNKYIIDRVASKTVYDSSNNTCQGQSRACAQTNLGYDTTSITTTSGVVEHDYTNFPSTMIYRGNRTTTSNWRNTDGAWLTTTNYYDDLGNLRQTNDPLSHNTYFDYTDSWSGTPCIPSGGTANAFATKVTNALGQFSTAKYFPCSSLTASSTDLNSLTSTFAYETFDRPTTETHADGGAITWTYNDTSRTATRSVKATSAASITTQFSYDGLLRITQSRLTSDPQGTAYRDITYDALSRQSTVSNPYRTSNDPGPTNGVTTSSYDALGRITRVTPPDGNPNTGANTVNTSYSGNCATVTDQAGKIRKSCSDALGRLTQVFEPDANNNLVNETDYAYDALDNLLTVNQKGNDPNSADWRTRTFVYNSLSQLTSASNPETGPMSSNGTITYSYNNDGVLISKADLRGVTINYNPSDRPIDPLHRVTEKTYSDSTPTVRYVYDGAAPPSGCTLPTLTIHNGVGKRTGMCDAAGSEAWSWDITSGVGWKITDARTTNSATKNTIYQHNFDGSLATLTYPSQRVITYTLATSGSNTASRYASAADLGLSINYAGGALYTPQGAIAYVQNGAGFYSTFLFNDRLQPCWFYANTSSSGAPSTCTQTGVANAGVLDFQYNFGLGSADNGNVNRITNRRNTSRSITYQYDELNRIHDAVTDATSGQFCWGQLFGTQNGSTFTSGYDPWGNLKTITPDPNRPGCGVNILARTINAYNKIVDSGYGYDNAGNMTADASGTYTFNAENQLTSAGGVSYTYDGDGKRVQKSNGKLYWYGMSSDPLDETDLAGNSNNSSFNEYLFFNGKRIARRDSSNNVFYYFADHLGTSREIVQAGQTTPCYDADFYPFGGEAVITTNTCAQNYKFTGKERDSESGLDNFGARYMESSLGRFMSPDSIANDWELGNPQTWNRYAYARNNPLIYIDPDGAAVELICTVEKSKCEAQRQEELNEIQEAVGNGDAASRLYINEVKDGDNTRYFVGIKGDASDFTSGKLGENVQEFGKLVTDKRIVEFGLTNENLAFWGGAATFDVGEHGNQHPLVLVNPDQAVALASERTMLSPLGRLKFAGQWNTSPPWMVQPFTLPMVAWHELGHGWAKVHSEVHDQEGPKWENRVREQLYGPLGPKNAPRERD